MLKPQTSPHCQKPSLTNKHNFQQNILFFFFLLPDHFVLVAILFEMKARTMWFLIKKHNRFCPPPHKLILLRSGRILVKGVASVSW